jgi:hypothetical protein
LGFVAPEARFSFLGKKITGKNIRRSALDKPAFNFLTLNFLTFSSSAEFFDERMDDKRNGGMVGFTLIWPDLVGI